MKTSSLQTPLGYQYFRYKTSARLSACLLTIVGGATAVTAASDVEFESAITLASPEPKAEGWYGLDVGAVPDVNGDSVNDFFVLDSPYPWGPSAGSPDLLHVYSGVTQDLLWTYESPVQASLKIAGIGDVNGDGFGDLIISGTTLLPNQPWVELLNGTNGDRLHDLPLVSGNQARTIAPVPDVTGDGVPDVVIASRNPSPNHVYIHDGATGERLRSLTPPGGPSQKNFFGYALAGVPDVTGDDLGDILIGNWQVDLEVNGNVIHQAGSAYLYNGATGEWVDTFVAPDPIWEGHFGRSVTVLDDVNGDGVSDFVIGANGMDCAYVFDGATRTHMRKLTLEDSHSTDFFGWTVKRQPDVSGDGINDVIVGGFRQPWGAIGEVFVLDPVTGETLAAFPDYSADDYAVAGLEDLNGDGLGEVLVGNYFGRWEGHEAAGFVSLHLSESTPPEDCDEDGLPDAWEYASFGYAPSEGCDLDILQSITPEADPDKDGSTNAREHEVGTNPMVADTDKDGIDDGAETKTWVFVSPSDTGTDPLEPDSDKDGLLDGVETHTGVFVSASATGTDPNSRDTDGEGLEDGAEINDGTDPTLADSDLDGLSDKWETDHATNPNDIGSPAVAKLKHLGEPTNVWQDVMELPTFDKYDGDLDLADVTFRLSIDFHTKQDDQREVIFETGGGTAGFSLVYEAGNKLVLRAAGSGGYSLAVAEALVPENSLVAGGEVDIMWSYDVENTEGTQTITLWLNEFPVSTVSMDLGGDWSGANGASFGVASTDLAGSGSNSSLSGSDFVSGVINLDKGLQFFGNTLPEIDTGDSGDVDLAISHIERAPNGEITLTWSSTPGTTYAVEHQKSLADAPWTRIANGLGNESLTTFFTDTDASRLLDPKGFYRVKEE